MNRIKLFILLFSLQSGFCYGQVNKKYTLEIFQETISAGLEKIFYYPDVNRNFQFVFVVKGYGNIRVLVDEQTAFVISLIKKTAEKNNIRYSLAKNTDSLSNDSVYYIVKIDDIMLSTKYPRFMKDKFLGEKTLIRQLNANISVNMESSNVSYSHRDNIVLNYTDEIDYDNYKLYESEYGFTKSKPPKVGALESVIFPVLLVTVSAAATILFFAIRSK